MNIYTILQNDFYKDIKTQKTRVYDSILNTLNAIDSVKREILLGEFAEMIDSLINISDTRNFVYSVINIIDGIFMDSGTVIYLYDAIDSKFKFALSSEKKTEYKTQFFKEEIFNSNSQETNSENFMFSKREIPYIKMIIPFNNSQIIKQLTGSNCLGFIGLSKKIIIGNSELGLKIAACISKVCGLVSENIYVNKNKYYINEICMKYEFFKIILLMEKENLRETIVLKVLANNYSEDINNKIESAIYYEISAVSIISKDSDGNYLILMTFDKSNDYRILIENFRYKINRIIEIYYGGIENFINYKFRPEIEIMYMPVII